MGCSLALQLTQEDLERPQVTCHCMAFKPAEPRLKGSHLQGSEKGGAQLKCKSGAGRTSQG